MSDNKDESVNRETALTTNTKDPGFWRELWQQLRLVYYLMLDPEVPIFLKVLPLVAVIYLLFPIDFVPDVVPVLGQLDDVTILIVGLKVFIEMTPPQVVARYMQRIRAADGYGYMPEENVVGLDDDPDIIEGVILDEENARDEE